MPLPKQVRINHARLLGALVAGVVYLIKTPTPQPPEFNVCTFGGKPQRDRDKIHDLGSRRRHTGTLKQNCHQPQLRPLQAYKNLGCQARAD